jgi:hypothetical protein
MTNLQPMEDRRDRKVTQQVEITNAYKNTPCIREFMDSEKADLKEATLATAKSLVQSVLMLRSQAQIDFYSLHDPTMDRKATRVKRDGTKHSQKGQAN